jgi:hypothetical protein
VSWEEVRVERRWRPIQVAGTVPCPSPARDSGHMMFLSVSSFGAHFGGRSGELVALARSRFWERIPPIIHSAGRLSLRLAGGGRFECAHFLLKLLQKLGADLHLRPSRLEATPLLLLKILI